jgi:thiamine pyrophosphate-dependent acetolactate synthase large subunit-like protein
MRRTPEYGSDVVVDVLAGLGVEYAALNPGASLRGLHDSIVNYAGNSMPRLILASHEETAVAIAAGYAKASGRPMVAIVHDIVGLLHASNAIFGSLLDQVPAIILGGGGPMAPENRRPWIDWIHTALIQGDAVRDYVKWHDQPTSILGLIDSVLRGNQIAMTEPRGPVYICVDAELQERTFDAATGALPALERFRPPTRVQGDPAALRAAAELLVDAERPVVIVERVGRDAAAFQALQELAELLALPVISPVTGPGSDASFPSTHPLDMTGHEKQLIVDADVVLNLEVFDISPLITSYDHHAHQRTSRTATIDLAPGCRYIDIALRHFRWRSWTHDYGMLLPTDLAISADVTLAVPELLSICRSLLAERPELHSRIADRFAALRDTHNQTRRRWAAEAARAADEGSVSRAYLARELGQVIEHDDWVLTNASLGGWARRLWSWDRPYRFVGSPGLGYGMGVSIGVALAHAAAGRLTVDVQADGDLMYTPSSLWTAAHHQVPLLAVMYNNRSYYNDEVHQESMAVTRGRPVENKGIGLRIEDPTVDFAAMARSFGVHAEGPVEHPDQLRPALEKAAAYVRERRLPALVDVVCEREARIRQPRVTRTGSTTTLTPAG